MVTICHKNAKNFFCGPETSFPTSDYVCKILRFHNHFLFLFVCFSPPARFYLMMLAASNKTKSLKVICFFELFTNFLNTFFSSWMYLALVDSTLFFLLVLHHIYCIHFSEKEERKKPFFVGYICSRHVENVWLVTVFIVIHFKHHLENGKCPKVK